MKRVSTKKIIVIILFVLVIIFVLFYFSIRRVARQVYPLYYASEIKEISEDYSFSPALLSALIYEESKFESDALSTKGAIGLVQILPDTANFIAEDLGYKNLLRDDLFKPEVNIRFGGYYLKTLLDKYGGNEALGLAAYNAGFGAVDKAGSIIENLPEETKGFVQKVERTKEIYTTLYSRELGLENEKGLSFFELMGEVFNKTSQKAQE